jgi:epoxide hydrolase-like predicted phosphatase
MPSGTSATLACSLIAAKALIVDFGGVLTTRIWDSFSSFCTSEGLDPDAVKELFRGDAEALKLLRQLERGELADEEFERRFGVLLGVTHTDGLIDRLFAGLTPDEEMLSAVRAARSAGLRTGLISNSWGTGIYERGNFDGLFDTLVISGEVGLNKPEPEIFHLACERLGVEPGDCVFVDDLRENCAGAEAVGMTAVLHRDSGQTIAELEELLGVELRASA